MNKEQRYPTRNLIEGSTADSEGVIHHFLREAPLPPVERLLHQESLPKKEYFPPTLRSSPRAINGFDIVYGLQR